MPSYVVVYDTTFLIGLALWLVGTGLILTATGIVVPIPLIGIPKTEQQHSAQTESVTA